jgi:competence protein ComFC
MKYFSKIKIYHSLWRLVDFVYPPSCTVCGSEGNRFCPECLSKVIEVKGPICIKCGKSISFEGICDECKDNPPPYDALRSWAEFNGPLRTALHHLKYRSDIGISDTLSGPLIKIAEESHWNFDIVIPIPIGKQHRKERGYNQAALIAYPIALAFNVPYSDKLIYRIKETKSQVNLTSSERFKNLHNAFQGKNAKLKDKRVLLVDDVTTTGATLNSCAKALADSGCENIYCLTVAKTPKYHQ